MSEKTDFIRDWLKALGSLAAASMSLEEANSRLSAFVPMLVEGFETKDFCLGSLRYVAERCKFFPAYGELVGHLNDWKREQPRPGRHPVLADDFRALGEKDRVWFDYWNKREREKFAPLRDHDGRLSRPDVTNWYEHTASMVRQYAPEAWKLIVSRIPMT